MALDKRQKEAFVKLFDGDENEANKWLDEHAEERNRAIESDGLITRNNDDDKPEAQPEPEPQEQEIVTELSNDDIARALEQSEPIAQIVSAVEAIAKQLEDSGIAELQRQKQITDSLQEMTARIEALEVDDEAKQREWLENQPRRFNTKVKHIIRPRVERADEKDKATFADVATSNLEAKGILNY